MSPVPRIIVHPPVCHGRPGVRDRRWPVDGVREVISSGMASDDILADHPELERDDITACLAYARPRVSEASVQGVA